MKECNHHGECWSRIEINWSDDLCDLVILWECQNCWRFFYTKNKIDIHIENKGKED